MFTNNLMMFSFRYLTNILVGDQLQQKVFWSFSQGDSRARASKFIPSTRQSQARWITVWIESTWRRRSTRRLQYIVQFMFQIYLLKIRQCDMLKFTTHTHLFLSFMFQFSVFDLTDLGFHEQILYQNKFTWFNVYQI